MAAVTPALELIAPVRATGRQVAGPPAEEEPEQPTEEELEQPAEQVEVAQPEPAAGRLELVAAGLFGEMAALG